MKKYLPALLIIIPFLIFKLFNLSVRVSDSNIYFYTGYQLLQGNILYKDIFFTNFPLIPYASALYFIMLFGSLKFFFYTPALEAAAVAILIYIIVLRQTKDIVVSVLSVLLYLSSFLVLATSDHQSGVFLASLFGVLGYYFFKEKRYIVAGVLIACMLLTKAYFLPVFASFLLVLLVRKRFLPSIKLLTAIVVTALIILLPTIFLAFPDFIINVFSYSLTRSQGVEKGRIIWFFLTHDPLLFMLLIANFYLLLKKNFFGYLSLFGTMFYFLYQDIYYLYLNFFVPFLCLSFPIWYKTVQKQFPVQKYVFPTILAGFFLYSIISYLTGFKDLQKIDINAMTQAVLSQQPKTLYGINSLTPALAYTTGVPLLNGVIDTNSNIFRKGFLSAEKMTEDAIRNKAMIVGEGLDYPVYGVQDTLAGEIFITDAIKQQCTIRAAFPIQNEGPQNRITLFSC